MSWFGWCSVERNRQQIMSCHVHLDNCQTRQCCEIIVNDAYALLCHLNFRLARLMLETVCMWTTEAGCWEISQFERKTLLDVIGGVPWEECTGDMFLHNFILLPTFITKLTVWSPGEPEDKRSRECTGRGAVVLNFCTAPLCEKGPYQQCQFLKLEIVMSLYV